MSHPGAIEGYGQQVLSEQSAKPEPQYLLFARKAVKWGADGVVAGATYPDKIREIRQVTGGKVPIYSPGIGAQGGDIAEAFKAGCKYAIVGRAIFESEDPAKSALEMKDKINRALKES
jgi:orotidine-5'-phosphate decarboxylase